MNDVVCICHNSPTLKCKIIACIQIIHLLKKYLEGIPREIPIRTKMRYAYKSHLREQLKFKRLMNASSGSDMEHLEVLYTVGRIANCYYCFGRIVWQFFIKLNICPLDDPAILLLSIYWRLKTYLHTMTCLLFMTTSFGVDWGKGSLSFGIYLHWSNN